MKKIISYILTTVFATGLGTANLSAQNEETIHIFHSNLDYEAITITEDTRIEFVEQKMDKILNVIETTPFSIKMHVNVPDTTNWIIALADRSDYESLKMQFGYCDPDFMSGMGCVHYQGPQTITIKDGDFWYTETTTNWETGELETYDYTYTVKPGSAYVLLLSAANYEMVPDTWPQVYRWLPDYTYKGGGGIGGWSLMSEINTGMNLGDYTEVCTDEGVTFNREYAKQYLWTNPAATPADTVEVEITKLTERTAYFAFYPPEDCLSYHVMPLTDADYQMMCDFIGEDGIQAYALNYGEPMVGGQEYKVPNLTLGATYHMLVVGVYDEIGAVQSFYHGRFTPKASTLPAPVMTVTAVPEKNTHEMVYFNIKCTSKNAADVRYIANYVKDWIPELNSGFSYADMIDAYGQYLTADELKKVNSDEGYEISYTSAEESDTRLAVIGFNVDEKAGKAVWADSRSLSIPAKTKVNSTLYEDLQGEWVLNYYDINNYYEKNKWRKFDVVITTTPEFGPATYEEWKNEESYNVVLNALKNDEARVKSLFEEYKQVVEHYRKKYEDQNQILAYNYPCGSYVYAASQQKFTPWDLFTSIYYSAYDNYQLFYDFGPKVLFEVVGENEMVLKCDLNNLPPLANFDGTYLMAGIGNDGYLTTCDFPVTISADKDSIIVHPFEIVNNDGTVRKYYPGTMRAYSGAYMALQNKTNDVLVYTRATANATATKKVNNVVENEIKKTKALYNESVILPVEGTVTTAAKRNAKLGYGPKVSTENKLFDFKANQVKAKK